MDCVGTLMHKRILLCIRYFDKPCVKEKKILKVKLTGIRMESFKQHLVPLYYTLTTIELL